MIVTLDGATQLEIRSLDQEGFDIQGDAAEDGYGPMQMFNVSLGLCTASVMYSYGQVIGADIANLTIRMRWEYDDKPHHRIGRIDMTLHWPDVPDNRIDAVRRAAASCTIHRTLEHPPELTTQLER